MSEVVAVGYQPSRRAELVELMATVWDDSEAGEHIEFTLRGRDMSAVVTSIAEAK